MSQDPPNAIRQLALRLGARADANPLMVCLTQVGTMRDAPGDREMAFTARQTISLAKPEFEWRARTGPMNLITVTDALDAGEPRLDVHALGFIPLARARPSPAAAKGEIMRYLAELAWAPDAILHNIHLSWIVVSESSFKVAYGEGEARGEVQLGLDAEGRIASIAAHDRPRKEGSTFVDRPWTGRFFDYRKCDGRWIPFAGEVGWILEGGEFTAWKGRLTSWSILE